MKYYLTIELKMAVIVVSRRIFKIKIWVTQQTILLEHGNYYDTFCPFSLPTEQKFYHSVKTSRMILMTQLWSRRQVPKLTYWKLRLPCFMTLPKAWHESPSDLLTTLLFLSTILDRLPPPQLVKTTNMSYLCRCFWFSTFYQAALGVGAKAAATSKGRPVTAPLWWWGESWVICLSISIPGFLGSTHMMTGFQ